MKFIKKSVYKLRSGSALIVSVIFVLVFSALAVSVAALSGVNLQIADNQHKVNAALSAAESGQEVMRYWISRAHILNLTPPESILGSVAAYVQNDLSDNGISNITLYYNGTTITVPTVALDTVVNSSFKATTRQINDYILQVDVTGMNKQMTRTIRVNYNLEPEKWPIFDFGLATKGPVQFLGNPTLEGVNYLNEADIFIESQNTSLALLVTGNTNFDGDVSIGNTNGNVDFQGDVQIGGDHGQAAIDNHVFIGTESPEFPVPDTGHFRQYATGQVINSITDTSHHMTLINAVIQAGANPIFGGNIRIQGVLFIESPNIVVFNRNVSIQGLIVGDGDVNAGTNSITFCGNFESSTFPDDSQFDVMRHEVGSSILAPGFAVSFEGNFASLAGVMAVSGAHFSGNVNALVEGTIINYSQSPTVIERNATLRFDRSNSPDFPAGFDYNRVPRYDSASYEEIVL